MSVPNKVRGNKNKKHRLGIPLSKESKRKMSEAAKGRKLFEETMRKMRGRKKS